MTARALLAGLVVTVGVVRLASAASAADTVPAQRDIQQAIEEGRFADAASGARALLASLGGLSATDQTFTLPSADLWLETLILNGQGSEESSQALAFEVLRRAESASPGDRRALVSARAHFGAVLFQAGDYRRAATELERAWTLRADAGLADDAAAVSHLTRLSDALLKVSRYDDALAACQRAVEIAQGLGNDTRSLVRSLNARASVWQWKGELSRARADLERARVVEARDFPRHPAVVLTLMLLGLQSIQEGDEVGARGILEDSVSIARATLRAGHPDLVSSLRALAVPVLDLGDLTRARQLQEEAFALTRDSFGPEHPLTAAALQDLAGTLFLQAEYEGARARYEAALKIYVRRFERDYPGTATVVYNLAILNAELGDFERARTLHRRAIGSWERSLGRDHLNVARGLWEFGQTLAEQHLDSEAVPLFERALSIRRRKLGDEHVDVAETLSSLAGSLARLGQRGRALELSAQAMGIWDHAGSSDTVGYVRSLMAHAAVLTADGQTAAAIDTYDRAMRIQLPALGPSHPEIAQIDAARAALLARVDRTEESLTLALRAEEVGRQHLSLTLSSLPERQALEYAAKRPQGLSLAISLVNPDRAAQVLDAVVRGRSLVLDEIALRRRSVSNEAGGVAAPQWTALRQARERLANLVIRGPGQQRADRYAALVAEAQQAKEDAERALAERSAVFRRERSRADIGLDQVRARLPEGSALVSIVRYDRQVAGSARRAPSYSAFVLRSHGGDPAIVPLGPAATIDALVARWRQAMIRDLAAASGSAPPGPSLTSVGISLRRRIWDPIAAHTGDATRVFVVPDGSLNLVPLSALPSSQGGYLVEDGPLIHYLSAERDLVVDETGSAPAAAGLLSVGGPAFSDGSSFAAVRKTTPAAAREEPSRVASRRDASINCSSFRTMRFDALPGSKNEARAVTDLWQRFESVVTLPKPQTLTGNDATERAFKQLAPGHRILHIATHGFFLGDDCEPIVEGTRAVGGLTGAGKPAAESKVARSSPASRAVPENPLLLSGLALAGANRRAAAGADEDDGILTAEEVAALNLEGVQWAVLSACDTGLGTVIAGEGVLGLRRAFQVAGVRTVIMSLWPVDDRATLQWMEGLYQARLGGSLSTADAVRSASVRVLRDRRASHRSTNPFYWAAFVASGDWR